MLTIILLIFAFLSLLLIKSIRDGSKKGRIASVFTDNIRYFNVQEFFNSGGIGYSLGIDEVKNSIVLVGSDLQFTVIPINELDGIHLYSNQEILKSSLPEEKQIVNSISDNNMIVLELILKDETKKNPTILFLPENKYPPRSVIYNERIEKAEYYFKKIKEKLPQ